MLVVALIVSVMIGFLVAAGSIGRESRRLGQQRREPVWRLEEAALFVEQRLAVDVASELEPDVLRDLLRWHLNQLQFERAQDAEVEISADHESTSTLYRQARSEGVEVARPAVDAVVAAHLEYLARIGALDVAESG